MNDHIICPFCETIIPLAENTVRVHYPSFEVSNWKSVHFDKPSSAINIYFYKCFRCKKISVKIVGSGSQYKDKELWFFPDSQAKQFPVYVPQNIREDYEEAFRILNLSPKASATLSRRCLQGMIRDKFKIIKNTLSQEINELQSLIDPILWKSIDALRKIGNIGAHMEKDVNIIVEIEPIEAKKLLLLIELLIHNWYVVPHERNSLLQEIEQIGNNKQHQRKLSITDSSSSK